MKSYTKILLTFFVIAVFSGLAIACPSPTAAISLDASSQYGQIINGIIYARPGNTVDFVGTANLAGVTLMDSFTWKIDGTTKKTETNTSVSNYSPEFTTA